MAKTKTKSWPKWPTKKDPETIRKLLDWFKSDFTIWEACSYAWISTETYYQRTKVDKQLSDEISKAKEYCFILAKNSVRKWLVSGDHEYSLKWLKNRQNKIYSERNENEINWKLSLVSENELLE